jgi:Protein kinase domain
VPRLNRRACNGAERSVGVVRQGRSRAGTVDRVAVDGKRRVRVAGIEVVEDVEGFELEAERPGMGLAPEIDILLQRHIEVHDAGPVGDGRLFVADAERGSGRQREGRLKLYQSFGSAMASEALAPVHTEAGVAPEGARGQVVDKRADIWAFGVVLWEMLTGKRMFAGETISDVLADVLKSEADLQAVPAQVRRLLARCLEKDPRKRLAIARGPYRSFPLRHLRYSNSLPVYPRQHILWSRKLVHAVDHLGDDLLHNSSNKVHVLIVGNIIPLVDDFSSIKASVAKPNENVAPGSLVRIHQHSGGFTDLVCLLSAAMFKLE